MRLGKRRYVRVKLDARQGKIRSYLEVRLEPKKVTAIAMRPTHSSTLDIFNVYNKPLFERYRVRLIYQ